MSLVDTHPAFQERDSGSEGTKVIQGETELCGFGERIGWTATNVCVLSPTLTPPIDAIFPVWALPSIRHEIGRFNNP